MYYYPTKPFIFIKYLCTFTILAVIFLWIQVSSHFSVALGAKSSTNNYEAKMMQRPNSILRPNDIRYQLVETDFIGMTKFSRYVAQDARNRQNGKELAVQASAWAESVAQYGPSEQFLSLLRESPFQGYFFETKGASPQTKTKPFEFVLVQAPQLVRFAESDPDPMAFSEYLSNCADHEPGCAFPNLGNNALLVAPAKKDGISEVAYSHLAAFCRQAPPDQVSGLFQMAAKHLDTAYRSQDRTVWFSTSGMGVAWLHFRLDQTPKYYQYKPFARET